MIGILDLDSRYPNVALMKIKRYYGDAARLITPIEAWSCDQVFVSSLFSFTIKPALPARAILGGTGYDIKLKLPPEIEACEPDYSLYNNEPKKLKTCYMVKDFGPVSMQRYSTGCIRSCPFCLVSEKEGFIQAVKPLQLNPNGKWVYIFDNNFFASPDWLASIKHLIACDQPVAFEGLDARIVTEEQLQWLKKVKLKKRLHFAWDNPKENLLENFKRIISIIPKRNIIVYVLIGFWSTPDEDLFRVESLRYLGIDSFVMPYNKQDRYQQRFARWCNHKAVFKKVKWSDYK